MHKSDHVISRQLDAFYKLITHVTNIQINKTALFHLPVTLPPAPFLSNCSSSPDSYQQSFILLIFVFI